MRIGSGRRGEEPNPEDAVERGDTSAIFNAQDHNIHVDFHAALQELKKSPELDVWPTLLEHTQDLHRSFQILLHNEPENQSVKSALWHVNLEKNAYLLLEEEQKLLEEFDDYRETSILGELIMNDRQFRQTYAIWRWCQNAAIAAPEATDMADEYEAVRKHVMNVRQNSIREVQRGDKQFGIDLDSRPTEDDKANSDRIFRLLFTLIRCNKIANAIDLVNECGMPSIAAVLRMYLYLSDPSLSPLDESHPNYSIGMKRSAMLKCFNKLALQSRAGVVERLVWGAVSGDRESLLRLATRTMDRIWSYANAAIVNMLNYRVTGEYVQETPKTVESIFGEITALEKSPYYCIYGNLLREDWDGLVLWLIEYVDRATMNEHPLDDQLVRFMATLASIARLKQAQHDEIGASILFSNVMNRLAEKKLFALIPFYASFLSRNIADDRLLDIMDQITEGHLRAEYLLALEEADLDRDLMAIAAGSEVGNNKPETRIGNLHWLLVNGERTLEHAVGQINCLVRYYTVNEDADTAQQVLQLAVNFGISEMVAGLKNRGYKALSLPVKGSIQEFECHQLFYFETYPFCEKFAKSTMELRSFLEKNAQIFEDSPSPSTNKTGLGALNLARDTQRQIAKQSVEKERARMVTTMEVHKQKAIESCEKFLTHRGYRCVYSNQSAKAEDMTKLRHLTSMAIVQLFVAACKHCEDQEGILDLAMMIAKPRVAIDQMMCCRDLRSILQKIVRSTSDQFAE